MQRAPERRVADMVNAIDRCLEYLPYLTAQDDAQTRMAQDAILRNLTILGEAIRTLPQDMTSGAEAIPWPKMRALRNLVVHEYFRVDENLIAEIVDDKLSPVLTLLLKMAYFCDLKATSPIQRSWDLAQFWDEEETWVYWSHLDYLSWVERAFSEQVARRERARFLAHVETELDWLIRTPWRIVYCPASPRDPDSDYQTLNWAEADLGTSERYEHLWGLYYAKWKQQNKLWAEEHARRQAAQGTDGEAEETWLDRAYAKRDAAAIVRNSEPPF